MQISLHNQDRKHETVMQIHRDCSHVLKRTGSWFKCSSLGCCVKLTRLWCQAGTWAGYHPPSECLVFSGSLWRKTNSQSLCCNWQFIHADRNWLFHFHFILDNETINLAPSWRKNLLKQIDSEAKLACRISIFSQIGYKQCLKHFSPQNTVAYSGLSVWKWWLSTSECQKTMLIK